MSSLLLPWAQLCIFFGGLVIFQFYCILSLQSEMRVTFLETQKRLQSAEDAVARFDKTEYLKSNEYSSQISEVEGVANDTQDLLLTYIKSRAPPAIKHLFMYQKHLVKEMVDLEQGDQKITKYIREKILVPPPSGYFHRPSPAARDTSRGNGKRLLHIFKHKPRGFFIECGALDGIWLSNTFYLERLLNWTGVLIEADAINFEMILKQKRDVISVPTCLSRSTKPQLVPFTFGRFAYSKIDTSTLMSDKTDNVLCMPFYSILLALNRTTVDLFSLDIEGHELDVLKTIPWDKVNIKVLIVEFLNIKEGKKALETLMLSKGYVNFPSTFEERGKGKWAEDDFIFVKKGSGLKEF